MMAAPCYWDLVQKQRLLLRREKNRESAARSNARRKREIDQLKRDWGLATARVAELRVVEARMLRENSSLRTRCEETGVTARAPARAPPSQGGING